MNSSQKRRLWIVVVGLMIATFVVIGRLVLFQIVEGPELAQHGYHEYVVVEQPERGVIYDRHGVVLAANTADYQIGINPNAVTEPEELATALAPILQEQRYQLLARLQSPRPYVLLEGRVDPQMAETLRALPYDGLQIEPMPRRFYPQGQLMCHILGYVDFEGTGGSGLEGYYQRELAGEAASGVVNLSPLAVQQSASPREGADLVLTIDRTVQALVERHLIEALQTYEATSGSIIVMDPRTGAVLAMASHPCYDPFYFFRADDYLLPNPAVNQQFEPGSVMKLVTMAAALDSGTVTPQTTYTDTGELFVGGHRTVNWDRAAYGEVDMTTLLANSLNVGAATLAVWMGPDTFYDYMQRFGFGRPTGIDLLGEANGLMPLPGDAQWIESYLATNSYGQALAVTPIQMAAAVSALANEGKLMQPYIVQEIHGPTGTYAHEPTVVSQPISADTARQLTAMSVTAVARETQAALVPGYTIAGKTGTAQIPENGIYSPDDTITTFAGWLPADNPELLVYVKLDRPQTSPWGSQTAAPVFSKLVRELVVLLGIPPDDIRLQAEVQAARTN